MKRFLKPFAFAVLLLLALATVACAEDPTVSPHTHAYGEWVVTKEPTYEAEGSRYRVCSVCQETETETIAPLLRAYDITIADGDEVSRISTESGGGYTLSIKQKIGYEFLGYTDADGRAFPLTGTLVSDVTIYPQYKLLPTTTFDELKMRMEAGADIEIAADILLSDTVFVSDKITVSTNGNYTLKRAEGFLGDLFVLGLLPDGTNSILMGKTASLTLRPTETGSLCIDGNKSAFENGVNGTAFLIDNSASLQLYDRTVIANCFKSGNDYLLKDDRHISSPELVGGAAAIIVSGDFTMHGGTIQNCEVDLDDSAVTDSELMTEGYNFSSRGGAVFNYGTFRMYGGVIENCRAARGGAIYNYRILYLQGGIVRNNHSAAYGGAFYNPDSQYVYAVIGEEGTTVKMTISGNTAGKTGGAVFASHQSTVYVMGSTRFEANVAQNGNGGALNIAGALVVDYAEFVKNTATSKGGAGYGY